MHTRIRQASSVVIILLLAVLPATINHFHNHSDAHVHHDCPVYQWETTFAATCVLLFGFFVAVSVLRFMAAALPRYIPATPSSGFNRRAPPHAYSRAVTR